jgi:hypothetical protein
MNRQARRAKAAAKRREDRTCSLKTKERGLPRHFVLVPATPAAAALYGWRRAGEHRRR